MFEAHILMCGLAGIFSLTGRPVIDAEARIRRMTSRLRHRGPDSQGVCVTGDGLLALGNTRLAIVDPNDRTPQPLWSADQGGVISFNGEIYNYPDIRARLASRGMRFRTGLDTEVLVELLRQEGLAGLEQIDGMWAFAYYDVAARRLWLSRDLLGERHLFYRVADGELSFASEMDALLADSPDGHELDVESALVALRYHVPAPGRTLIKGFHRLKCGTVIEAAANGQLVERTVLRLKPERWAEFFASDPSLGQIMAAFDEVLSTAASRRVPREVPFVATLSGGIDSTLVCAYASDHGGRPIDTLFGQTDEKPGRNRTDELDEYEASLLSSRRFNTRHSRVQVDTPNAVRLLQHVADTAADGMLDWGVASFQMLAEQAKQRGIKVMLVSEGPDELLGGYKVDRIAHQYDLASGRNRLVYGLLGLACHNRVARGVLRRILKRPDLVRLPTDSRVSWWSAPHHQAFEPDYLSRLLPARLLASSHPSYGSFDARYDAIAVNLAPTQKRALAYASTSIPDYSNLRLDKAFMAASVECRSPHLAPAVVEMYIGARDSERFGESRTKYILRKIVERDVGPEVAFRSKHGFSAPIWRSQDVLSGLRLRERIGDGQIFDALPFNDGARERVLSATSTKVMWPMFVLSVVLDRLKSGYALSMPMAAAS